MHTSMNHQEFVDNMNISVVNQPVPCTSINDYWQIHATNRTSDPINRTTGPTEQLFEINFEDLPFDDDIDEVAYMRRMQEIGNISFPEYGT